MVDASNVEPYIPQFFWRFWLSDAYVLSRRTHPIR